MLLGFAVLLICYAFLAPALMRLDFWLYRQGIADIRDLWLGGYSTAAHLAIGGTFSMLAGFAVGLTHRPHRRIVVPVFLALILVNQLIEFVPAAVAAGFPSEAREVWGKLILDLFFVRVPILLVGVVLVRDRR